MKKKNGVMDQETKAVRLSIRRKIKENTKSVFNVKCLSKLNSDYIFSIKPKSVSNEHHWKDCVRYLIHFILISRQEERFKPGTKYVPLKYDYLKQVMGSETSIVINTLVQNKVIVRDMNYSKGRTAIGYKINPRFEAKGKIINKTLHDDRVTDQWMKVRAKLYEEQKELLYQNAHLVKWLMSGRLILLNRLAEEYMKLLKQAVLLYFQTHCKKMSATEIEAMLDDQDSWISLNPDDSIINMNDLPKISKKGFRLYSCVTAMYSPLRNLLLYDNLPLVYYDISNSQPFHFLLCLKSSFWKRSKNKDELSLYNLNRELYEWLEENYKREVESTIMTLENHESRSQCGFKDNNRGAFRKSDLERTFSFLAMNGKLYKFISDNFSGTFKYKGVDPFGTVEKAKEAFIEMFYAENKKDGAKNTKYFRNFEILFPFEAKVITLLKKRDYRDFSILLQQIESNIMLGRVCKDINDQNPSIPMFTIHDGILSSIYYENEVRDALQRRYQETMGVVPKLKKEYLRPSNLDINKFIESVIKKTKAIAEANKLQFVEPTLDFYKQVCSSYSPLYERIKDIPQIWFPEDLSVANAFQDLQGSNHV